LDSYTLTYKTVTLDFKPLTAPMLFYSFVDTLNPLLSTITYSVAAFLLLALMVDVIRFVRNRKAIDHGKR